MEKQCEYCKKRYKTGRKSKRFCNPSCSNKYHGHLIVEKGKRICIDCKVNKPKKDFNRIDHKDRGKYELRCRGCKMKFNKKNEKTKSWYHDKIPMMICNARNRAKKFNVPFSLNRKDIVIPKRCPVFGINFKEQLGKSHSYFSGSYMPSIDRVIPELGYVPDNIIIISCRANSIKNNATIDELIKITRFYKKLFKGRADLKNKPK